MCWLLQPFKYTGFKTSFILMISVMCSFCQFKLIQKCHCCIKGKEIQLSLVYFSYIMRLLRRANNMSLCKGWIHVLLSRWCTETPVRGYNHAFRQSALLCGMCFVWTQFDQFHRMTFSFTLPDIARAFASSCCCVNYLTNIFIMDVVWVNSLIRGV